MKKKLALLLAGVMLAVSLAGCGGSSSDSSSSAGSGDSSSSSSGSGTAASADSESAAANGADYVELHVAYDSDPGSLSPFGVEGPRNVAMTLMYESLGNISPDKDDFYLVLAKEIDQVSENVYDVEIYDYIYDTAGNHITASDVIFSFNEFDAQGYLPQYTSSLKGIEQTGDYTVEITMVEDAKIGAFETMLEKVKIISEESWNASPDQMQTTPVGTTAYTLAEYKSGETLIYEKTDNYWQTDESKKCVYQNACADKIILDIITDTSTQAIALESGEIDISQFISVADIGNFVNDDTTAKEGYNVSYALGSAIFQLVFNCSEHSPLADQNLREAVAYAIDAAQVMDTGFGINGNTVSCMSSPYNADYDPSLDNADYFLYDLDKAKELVAASNYNGESLKILVTPNFPSVSATLIQSYLNAAGINAELMLYENAMYLTLHADNSGTEYDIDITANASTGYTWSAMLDYDDTYFGNGLPHTVVKDNELQKAYENMAGEDTNSIQTVKAFSDYVTDNCYGYSIGYKTKSCVARDRVTDIVFNEWGDLVPGACQVVAE